MRALTPWKEWAGRILQLGMSRLVLAIAVLFVVLAIASPMWSYAEDWGGGERDVADFTWTTRTVVSYESGGQWGGTEIRPYTSRTFSEPNIAGAMGASYLAALVYLVVLVVVLFLFSMERTRTISPLFLLILSLVVVIVSLLALFYPILGVQSAAPTDLAALGINGFWGSRADAGRIVAWGAGLGWWLLFVAVILGIVGVALPYVKSVRAMGTPKPRGWTPRR